MKTLKKQTHQDMVLVVVMVAVAVIERETEQKMLVEDWINDRS